jgi:hypothetical protein
MAPTASSTVGRLIVDQGIRPPAGEGRRGKDRGGEDRKEPDRMDAGETPLACVHPLMRDHPHVRHDRRLRRFGHRRRRLNVGRFGVGVVTASSVPAGRRPSGGVPIAPGQAASTFAAWQVPTRRVAETDGRLSVVHWSMDTAVVDEGDLVARLRPTSTDLGSSHATMTDVS